MLIKDNFNLLFPFLLFKAHKFYVSYDQNQITNFEFIILSTSNINLKRGWVCYSVLFRHKPF